MVTVLEQGKGEEENRVKRESDRGELPSSHRLPQATVNHLQRVELADQLIDGSYNPQALTPMAPATAEATAMMILRITSQVDFFMMLDF